MVKGIIAFFDGLEDRIRGALSRRPFLYALVGGTGIVLFWKGVWETAEFFPALHGPPSILLGMLILLISGLMVSFFIGDSIILSGLNREKKLVEKATAEMRKEQQAVREMADELEALKACIEDQPGSRETHRRHA